MKPISVLHIVQSAGRQVIAARKTFILTKSMKHSNIETGENKATSNTKDN